MLWSSASQMNPSTWLLSIRALLLKENFHFPRLSWKTTLFLSLPLQTFWKDFLFSLSISLSPFFLLTLSSSQTLMNRIDVFIRREQRPHWLFCMWVYSKKRAVWKPRRVSSPSDHTSTSLVSSCPPCILYYHDILHRDSLTYAFTFITIFILKSSLAFQIYEKICWYLFKLFSIFILIHW